MYPNPTNNANKVNNNTNHNNDNSLNSLTDFLNSNNNHINIDQLKMEPLSTNIALPQLQPQTPSLQNHISLLLNNVNNQSNQQMHTLTAGAPLIHSNYTNNILLLTPNGLLSLPTTSPSLLDGISAINTINAINTFSTQQNPLQSLFPSLPIHLLDAYSTPTVSTVSTVSAAATGSTALPSVHTPAVSNGVPLSTASFPAISTRNFMQDLPPKLDSALHHQQSVHILQPAASATESNTNSSEFVSTRNHTKHHPVFKMESIDNDIAEMNTKMKVEVRCNGCNKKYIDEKDLLQHLKLNQTNANNKKPYACTKCCKSFTRLGNLNNHNRTHRQVAVEIKKSESPLSIPPAVHMDASLVSDKNKHIIMSEYNRMKIERANSVTAKPFKCDECSKAFRNKSGLSNHRIIHNGQKPHKCTFSGCGKSFARSCDLTRHIRLHTGYKPFKCQYKTCNKSFTRSVQLRLHLMDHTGQRPFKCDICMKGFKTLQNAQIHMRIHTGEKPYACTYCKKRFTQSSSLKTHLSSIHSEE